VQPAYSGYPPPGYPPYPPPGYPPYPPQVATAPNGAPLADFGSRLLAWLIDRTIVGAIALALDAPAFAWWFSSWFHALDEQQRAHPGQPIEPNSADFMRHYAVVLGVAVAASVIVSFCYYVYGVKNGQTIGKRAMKLRIVRLTDGRPPARGELAKRWAVQDIAGGLIPLASGLFSWLDGLWQLWDKPYRQCLHDKWPATTVVKVV
jgi:uncharacterized RDD family membrane protein YckC